MSISSPKRKGTCGFRPHIRDNYQRLIEIKRRWDPDNMLQINKNTPRTPPRAELDFFWRADRQYQRICRVSVLGPKRLQVLARWTLNWDRFGVRQEPASAVQPAAGSRATSKVKPTFERLAVSAGEWREMVG